MLSIMTILALVRIPGRRREHVLDRMSDEGAAHPDWVHLEPSVQAAIAKHQDLTTLRHRYEAARATTKLHGKEARKLDPVLDRCHSALASTLEGLRDSLEPGSEFQQQAVKMLDTAYPSGVVAVTSLPYVEQHVAGNVIVRTLRAPEFAEAIEALGLEMILSRLEALNQEYGALLTRPEDLTPERLKESDDAAWAAYLEVAVAILAQHPTDGAEDQAARAWWMRSIMDQQAEFLLWRQRRARGRAYGDGDLDSSVILDDPADDEADIDDETDIDVEDTEPAPTSS